MQEYNVPLGIDLMQSLEQGLNAEKYEVVVLREQDMGYANPKDFDYGKIITDADALAHIIITETGVSSSLRKPNYKPRLNVDVKIISSKDQTKIDDWTVEYGADASKLNDGSFPSDPKFAWSDYDVVMQKIPEVIEGLQQGAKLLGGHIAKTVRERKL